MICPRLYKRQWWYVWVYGFQKQVGVSPEWPVIPFSPWVQRLHTMGGKPFSAFTDRGSTTVVGLHQHSQVFQICWEYIYMGYIYTYISHIYIFPAYLYIYISIYIYIFAPVWSWHHIRSSTRFESDAGTGKYRNFPQCFKLVSIKKIKYFVKKKIIKMIIWWYIIFISCWLRWMLDLSPIFQTSISEMT